MMTHVVVEICRASTANDLQSQIGATTAYWLALGFTKVKVQYAAASAGHAVAYTRTNTNTAPAQIWNDAATKFTAVLVIEP